MLGAVFGVLGLGLLIGMQHALEADHLAAVSSMAARQTSARGIVRHGLTWGVGHAITLAGLAGGSILLGLKIGEGVTAWLEAAVGVMLVVLGGLLLLRLWRDRVHFHSHQHSDGELHFHAHSHQGESGDHAAARHDHDHSRGFPLRTLLVGMMHGTAGSAALIILVASTIVSPAVGVLYILIFGVGSIIGMGLLSAVIALPLAWSAQAVTLANRTIQCVVGVVTVGLGGVIVYQSAAILQGLG